MIAESPYYYTRTLDDDRIFSEYQVMLSLNIEDDYPDSVSLKDATLVALDYLNGDEDGFVLIVEQAHIDKRSHKNDISGMLKRMQSLGETVDAVMEWIGSRADTAVIVTADHETGGLWIGSSPNPLATSKTYTVGNKTLHYTWGSVNHTKELVDIYVYGISPDFASFDTFESKYIIKNTDTYRIMKDIIDSEKSK